MLQVIPIIIYGNRNSLKNVEKQRGKGVFDQSVTALQSLNKLGYGVPGTGLELHLVYNPVTRYLKIKLKLFLLEMKDLDVLKLYLILHFWGYNFMVFMNFCTIQS